MPSVPTPTVEVRSLRRRYGPRLAVDDLTFTVHPGRVTGFLGPNGAGKSTTFRLMLGLDRPDTGSATFSGVAYRDLPRPLLVVGALLEAGAVHPGRTVRDHLLWLAHTQGLPRRRVDEVVDLVGLGDVARRRAGALSLGMGQRLGLAAALLGDPRVLLLDEPLNGLDPAGVVWIRTLIKDLAADGRAVLVSSHLMHEMAVTADHLLVVSRGRLVADCSTAEFVARAGSGGVSVRTDEPERLTRLVAGNGGSVRSGPDRTLLVTGVPAPRLAELAAADNLVLYELTPRAASLEEAFIAVTGDGVEYAGRPLHTTTTRRPR